MFHESPAQPQVAILHLGGVLGSCRTTGRYASDGCIYPWRRNSNSVFMLHCGFLTAFPLFLCPPPSLISNGSDLPSGTQGKSGRLKAFSYTPETGGTEKLLFPGRAPQGDALFHKFLLGSHFCHIDFFSLKLCGGQKRT